VLKIYCHTDAGLETLSGATDAEKLTKTLWIAAASPTKEEEEEIEKALDMDLDPDSNLSDLPIEQPFLVTKKQISMNALVVCATDEQRPSLVRVTFLRAKGALVSMTTDGADVFDHLLKKYPEEFKNVSKPDELLAALLKTIIDDTADMLDKVSERLDHINEHIFQHHISKDRRDRLAASPRLRNRQLERLLHALGFTREMLVKVRRSILSLRRLVGALHERSKDQEGVEGLEALIKQAKGFDSDLRAISDAEEDLSSTAAFMLDGAVGFIGIQQNKTVAVLTVISIVLTPPILVAGIYGMNFKQMPELEWTYGYAYSLVLMAATGLLTFGIARWRGWL
jgi:magnesium transporter